MAFVTSLFAPPLMKLAWARIPEDSSEEERLKREQRAKHSLVAQARRILVPVRLRSDGSLSDSHLVEVDMLNRLSEEQELSVSLFSVVSSGQEVEAKRFLEQLSNLLPHLQTKRLIAVAERAGDVILDEARKGYDLILMGTPEPTHLGGGTVFTPMIDYLLRLAPCPILLVRGIRSDSEKGLSLRRVLIPTNGSAASEVAADFSFSLFTGADHDLFLLKVIESTQEWDETQFLQRQFEFSREMIKHQVEDGNARGAKVQGRVILGDNPCEVISRFVVDYSIDLVVLGTNVRLGGSNLYLGSRVERLLRELPCAVLVVNT
jgi:nucleotide-binding universal stress UspA family protein